MTQHRGMYRTWLLPYLDGTLGPDQRAEMEERLADDPALAAEMYALRRSLPQVRARFTPSATFQTLPLWPHLRDRLAKTRRRQARPALLWCAAGALLIAALLPLASGNQRWISRQDRMAEAKWRREMRHAPRVVFGSDNALGTRTEQGLEARARRVGAERRAAASRPTQPS